MGDADAAGMRKSRRGILSRVDDQEEDDFLDDYERFARDQLEPVLGALRVTDVPGGMPGMHDFEAVLRDGRVAAVEITAVVDSDRLRLSQGLVKRQLDEFHAPNSKLFWHIRFKAEAQLKSVSLADLTVLVLELEEQGRTFVSDLDNSRDHWAASRLRRMGIELASGHQPQPGSEGVVFVSAGSYGGWGWDRATTDTWLGGFLAGPGRSKLAKLARAESYEKHLVIVLDSFSPAGVGIPLALSSRRERGAAEYDVPSTVPSVVSHLWLISTGPSWDGLKWSRADGWQVLSPVPFVEREGPTAAPSP